MHRFFIPPDWIAAKLCCWAMAWPTNCATCCAYAPARIVVLDDRGWEYEIALVSVENKRVARRHRGAASGGNEPSVG